MILKELRENLTASLVSKGVKHTTPPVVTASEPKKPKKEKTTSPVEPKGMFEKIDHPEWFSGEQEAKIDMMDNKHKQHHQQVMIAQKTGDVQAVKKHTDMMKKIRFDALQKKEKYRKEHGGYLTKNMDV